jgi:ATP-dependent Clp protease adapter protein ClpS
MKQHSCQLLNSYVLGVLQQTHQNQRTNNVHITMIAHQSGIRKALIQNSSEDSASTVFFLAKGLKKMVLLICLA